MLALIPDVDVKPDPNARQGYALSLTGCLKLYFNSDPADMKDAEARERHRRFRDHALAALDPKLPLSNREIGRVLVDAFGGNALRADFARREADALIDAIETAIAVKH